MDTMPRTAVTETIVETRRCVFCMYPVGFDVVMYYYPTDTNRGLPAHAECVERERGWQEAKERNTEDTDEQRLLRSIRAYAVDEKLSMFSTIKHFPAMHETEKQWLQGNASAMHKIACMCENHIHGIDAPPERRLYDGASVWQR